jgi:hypothetical protein
VPYGEWADVGGLVRVAGGMLVVKAATSFPLLATAWSHHGFGRPLKPRKPLEVVAWLADCTRLSQYRAIQLLYGDRPSPKAAHRYDRDAGRRHLHDHGVLPWAAWPDGKVAAAWWEQPPWEEGVTAWLRSAWQERQAGAVGDQPEIPKPEWLRPTIGLVHRAIAPGYIDEAPRLSKRAVRSIDSALEFAANNAVPKWRFSVDGDQVGG